MMAITCIVIVAAIALGLLGLAIVTLGADN
jgi:hypothetical protein